MRMRPAVFGRSTAFVGLVIGIVLIIGGCPPTASTGTGTDTAGNTTTGTTTGNTGGTAGTGTTTPQTVEVEMRGFAFSPKEVTIHKGDSVKWVNRETSAIPHTVTSGNPGATDAGQLWDSGDLNPGQSFTHKFDAVGAFTYFCRHHSSTMHDAKVTVE